MTSAASRERKMLKLFHAAGSWPLATRDYSEVEEMEQELRASRSPDLTKRRRA